MTRVEMYKILNGKKVTCMSKTRFLKTWGFSKVGE